MSTHMGRMILASASPRRARILQKLGLRFEIVVPDVDETPLAGEAPAAYVVRTARAKAADAARQVPDGLIVAADTAVVIDGRPLGKPADAPEARAMLRALSGQWHAVLSGVAIRQAATGVEHADYDKTLVRFRNLNDAEIDAYLATREPFDKAGAYAIQGVGMLFVEEIAGNYQNVVGLPVTLLDRLMKRFGINLLDSGVRA